MTDFDIIETALKIADSAERERYLQQAAGDDPSRFRRLIAQVHEAAHFEKTRASPGGTPAEANTVIRRVIGDLSPGVRIGPYKLLQLLGEGGMGAVWMAEQEQPVRRVVALKAIKPGMDSDQVLGRFEAERQALALMDHPNIAKVLDAGTTMAGHPYFVMELVKGITLTKYCDDHQLDIRARLELFIPICHAIQHAHQKGIIHRDVKPSNVLIAQYDGRAVPKVIDFGVAKAIGSRLTEKTMFTGFGSVIGTLEYMSPEQAEFNALDVDTRSDIYSLGVLLYELLTGTTPLGRDAIKKAAFDEVLRRIKEETPPKPSTRLSESKDSLPTVSAHRHIEPAKLPAMVRGDLDWIVMKALAKERERRYETANSFAVDLLHYLNDEPVNARPPGAMYLFKKFVHRHRAGAFSAGIVIMALIAATAFSTIMYVRATNAQAAEEIQFERAVQAHAAELQQRQRAEKAHADEIEQRKQAEQAKAAAVEQRQTAEKARAAESEQKDKAIQARNNAQATLNFFRDVVLKSARPPRKDGGMGTDVKLIDALRAAEDKIEPVLSKFPHVESSVRQVLGTTFYEIGDYDRAVLQLNGAYQIRRKDPQADVGWTCRSQHNLIASLGKVGKYDDALARCEELVKELQADPAAKPENVLTAQAALGECYRDAKRFDDSLRVYEQLLPKMTKEFGDEHIYTLTTKSNQGKTMLDSGQHEPGLKVLQEVLDRRRIKPGPAELDTYLSMLTLASGYIQAGRPNDGVEQYLKAFPIAVQLKIEDHPDTLNAMAQFAGACFVGGQFDKAEPPIRELLNRLKTDAWQAFRLRCLLGTALAGQKKSAEAEAELKAGYDGLKTHQDKIPSRHRGRTLADAADRLADHYASTSKPEEAEKWRQTARSHRDRP